MKPRPTIFISGVSGEFHAFRDAVENEVEMKGWFAENQPGFPPDYVTVEEMLRRKMTDADAVIHIVGFRFGAEPKSRPADVPRRSYTQMEFDLARAMEKPVFVFISRDASVRQPPPPDEAAEDAQAVDLQFAHRDAVTKTNHLYYHFSSQAELCKLVAEIPLIATAEFRVDVSRILKYAPADLIGREAETKLLNDAWLKVRRCEAHRPHVLTFVALGGQGKTSLVAEWVAKLADDNWPGCDAAFAWSFYSQGTREQMASSSDLFLKEALTFFGDDEDKEFAASPAGAFEKGQRLARIIGQRRCLLILDGLEPLQYAPTAPTPGELKDQGIAALLKGLAAASQGLCLVTTRYSLPDLRAFWQTTAPEVKLLRLSRDAGVHLLKTLGVRGTAREFETLAEDVKGHALTLQILGGFLHRAFGGDIRQRDRVKFEKADEKIDGGHAFRAMAAYAQWMEDGSDEARRELALLRCLGLFDRPATGDCLEALLQPPAIAGLTDPLVGLAEEDWNFSVTALESANLLSVARDDSLIPHSALRIPHSLDAHPHIREYFAKQLREKTPDAWRAAHRRLYEHLCANTKEGDRPTLEALQPLYQAVAHGCLAGLQQEVFNGIYINRINQGERHYAVNQLGTWSSELGCLASFFECPYLRVVSKLDRSVATLVRNQAGFALWILGRYQDAQQTMSAIPQELNETPGSIHAIVAAANLSSIQLESGHISESIQTARRAAAAASSNSYLHGTVASCTALAKAYLAKGDLPAALAAATNAIDNIDATNPPSFLGFCMLTPFVFGQLTVEAIKACQRDRHRETIALSWISRVLSPHGTRSSLQTDEFLGRLLDEILSGAKFYFWFHSDRLLEQALQQVVRIQCILLSEGFRQDLIPWGEVLLEANAAVDLLRTSGQVVVLPHGLLTRVQVLQRLGIVAEAKTDLDEAWEIAERGPMRLFLADIHLYRARLFGRLKAKGKRLNYPWDSPEADLKAAEELITKCDYHRRDEELADAKQAILGT